MINVNVILIIEHTRRSDQANQNKIPGNPTLQNRPVDLSIRRANQFSPKSSNEYEGTGARPKVRSPDKLQQLVCSSPIVQIQSQNANRICGKI